MTLCYDFNSSVSWITLNDYILYYISCASNHSNLDWYAYAALDMTKGYTPKTWLLRFRKTKGYCDLILPVI